MSIRTAFAGPAAAAALVLALAACGADTGTDDQEPAAPPSAPASAAPPASSAPPAAAPESTDTGQEADVEAAFRGWQEALAAEDFAAACALNTPEANDALVQALTAGGAPVATCEEGYAVALGQEGAVETSRTVAETTEIQAIAVDGENATLTWSAQVQDQRATQQNRLRLDDGQWRMLPVA